jgi:hypothetical protein
MAIGAMGHMPSAWIRRAIATLKRLRGGCWPQDRAASCIRASAAKVERVWFASGQPWSPTYESMGPRRLPFRMHTHSQRLGIDRTSSCTNIQTCGTGLMYGPEESVRVSGCAVAGIVQTPQLWLGDHRTRHRRRDSPRGTREPRYREQPVLEGSMEVSRDNKDAPEQQHEITDAKQSQPRLICEKQ